MTHLPSLLPAGLSKSSDQAYIEFESVEAIVKTASRTKFFIEFYSTCLEGGWPEGFLTFPTLPEGCSWSLWTSLLGQAGGMQNMGSFTAQPPRPPELTQPIWIPEARQQMTDGRTKACDA